MHNTSHRFKLHSYVPSFHEFSQPFTLLLIVGTGIIEVARGLVIASVAFHDMAAPIVGLVFMRAAERFAKPLAVGTVRLVGFPPTTVYKYEPRATRGFTNSKRRGNKALPVGQQRVTRTYF
ncbi:hypothetical protein AVEN_105269-1 [Araneus ventricosus]|uniref:Uncharacterized protein n=2 Tax=Araneus ventricosus TaxID=182803 RepID=A0A4Y2MC81_ARAVE|nr:hypothetical protein AVEN_233967-1 [Araneus ventricosus]GBN24060.1 hypothetical protein AVEN_105269-1 [Araneus ventricosus]